MVTGSAPEGDIHRVLSLWMGSLQVLCKPDIVTVLIVPRICASRPLGAPASGDPMFVHPRISQNVTGKPENHYVPRWRRRGGEKVEKGGSNISTPPSNTTDRSFLK